MRLQFQFTPKQTLNANRPLHYMTKAKKIKYIRELAKEVGEKNKAHFDTFTVKVIIYGPTKRAFDPPNFYPTVKALIDGLTDANYWEDDSFEYMKEMTFCYGGIVKEHFDIKEKDYVFILELQNAI